MLEKNKQISRVIESVIKSPKQDILIPVMSAKRRVGLFSEIENQIKKLNFPIVPVRILLDSETACTAEKGLDFVLDRVIISLSDSDIMLEEPCETGAANFVGNIKSIVKLSKSVIPNIRIVLLIDNIDCLLGGGLDFVDNMPIKLLNSLLQSELGSNLSAIFRGEFSESKISEQSVTRLFGNFKRVPEDSEF